MSDENKKVKDEDDFDFDFEFLKPFKELGTSDKFMLSIGFVMVLLIFFVGGILVNGIIFGFLAAIGMDFLLLYSKDGYPKLWNWVIDHKAVTDIGTHVIFLLLLNPTTAIGIIGGVSAGIFASISLMFFRKVIGRVETENKIQEQDSVNKTILNTTQEAV